MENSSCLFENEYIICLKENEIQIIDINRGEPIKSIKIQNKLFYIKKFWNSKEKNMNYFLGQSNSGELFELHMIGNF